MLPARQNTWKRILQTPDTISIKVEEDIGGGLPAVEDCDAFRDRSTQRGATSESLGVVAPGSSHMSSHSEELKILSVYGKGEGPLAEDGHDTLFTASEVEALNSLSADHSAAKSLERAERLVCREELSVQQTPDTISIKVEEDIGGGMPAIEDNDIRDCSTQRGATSESLRVDAPGSSHMSGHSGELRILSVYGQGEGPLAVDGHDTLFAASELEALSSLSADHSVAKSLNCSVRLVRLEELTGHQGGRKGRPGVLCGKVVPNNANMIVHMRTHSGEKPYKRFSLKGTLNRHMMNHSGKITRKSAAAHRHYLLCPVCLRTQESLSCHLRRVCMKDKTPPQILEVVEKAKKDVCDLLKNGRAFSYAVLKQIVSSPNPLEGLIEELKYHHLFVTGVPPPLPIGNPRLVTETLSECPGEAPGETEPSDVESCGSNELFQCRQEKTYTKDKMVKAKDLGILKKHSADHPLLKRFADYLKNDYENAKYQQEVDTVSRYLYFADPTEPSLKFVNDREKLRDFLGQQAKAGYKAQTSGNYIKCLKRFLEFHLTRTGLRQDDGELYKQCTLYLSFLTSSQSVLSKQASKEIVQKSHALSFDKSQPTPHECLAVLDKGEGDLVKIMNQLDDSSSSSLSRTECIFVLYYLEAIVILRHCQQPCVVQSMKVKEWLERKHADDDSIVFVKDHKTAAHFVVSIVLSKKEEAWFEKYYTKVRPQLLAGERKRKRDEQDEKDGDDFFFVSSRGKPINNAAGDLIKLQQKCNVPQVSSQVVRRVFETAANRLDDPQKKAVSDYLGHSGTTADRHYRMKSLESIVIAAGLLKKLQRQKKSSAGPSGEGTRQEALGEGTSPQSVESSSHGDHCALPQPSLRQLVIDLERIPEGNDKVKFHEAFKSLLENHPVTLSGQIPKVRIRRDTSEANQRKLYTHWAQKQLEMRVKHTREQFNRRRPTKERVDTWVKKQGWKCKAANISTEVVENWAPSGSEDRIMDNKRIQTLLKTQDWKGLHITQFEEKGDGIITTRTFKKGEVVCDYHGPVVSGKEGENIHKNTTGKETGYIFFFRNSKGQPMCIDAHSDRCHCHPDKRTFGRLVNHSKKNSNIKPLHCVVDKHGEMKDVILFIATKELPVGEEVLFDY